ncbi:inositol phosphatase [Candidatus Micrarchaeota archaeon]|nr:inositol phosphatase [Candidatus Micrarchaeota archaeon]
MKELEDLLKAADAADAVLLKHFRKPLKTKQKPDGSWVTQADEEAEKAVLAVLRDAFPDCGVLAEESGESGSNLNRWVIDPLDGTHSYMRGLPFCGPLLAFEKNGEVLAGVISLPMLKERVWAEKGKGCFWNGKQCRVSTVSNLTESFLTFELKRSTEEGFGPALLELSTQAKNEKGYSDAYAYFLVATGQAEAFIEGYPHPWDVAAPRICLQEAGGKMTKLAGKKNGLNVASNAALHKNLCDFLSSRRS